MSCAFLLVPFFGWLSLQTANLLARRTLTNFTAKPFVRYQSPSADYCLFARKVDVVSDDDETDEAHQSLKRCDNNNYLMSPLSLDMTCDGTPNTSSLPFVYTSTGKVITAEETNRAKEVISQRLTMLKIQPGAQQRRLSNPSPKSQPSPLVSPSSSHSPLLLTPALRDRSIVSLTCAVFLPFVRACFVHFQTISVKANC